MTGYKDNDKGAFYLIDHLIKTIDLPELIESESNVQLKWSKGNNYAKSVCPFPDHRDSKASFFIKRMGENDVWLYHCLTGDTRVITYEGVRDIKDLAGTTQRILTKNGKWVDAPFLNFGKQKVFRINLSRNRQKKTIRATSEHRWLLRRENKYGISAEKTTTNLKKGDCLAWSFARNTIKHVKRFSPQGISHGIVFGDGSIAGKMSYVDLWGGKNIQLLKWFSLNRTTNIKCPSGLEGIKVLDLPLYYKGRPSINESTSYLAGWLAGWLAADGHVAKDGTIMLNSSNKENLEFARLISTKLGIGTYGITCQSRLGLGKEKSNIYRIHFVNKDMDERFFLIEEHKKRFLNCTKLWPRKSWSVVSVEDNNEEEDVFCAVVDKTHSFTLEDNILTGNCFGCSKKGNVIHFCMDYFGLRNKYEAILFLCKRFKIENKEDIILAGLKNITKRVDVQRKIESANIVTSNQCRILLRKDFIKHKVWVADAYKILNDALEKEDYDSIENIGYEASNRMRL